MTTKYSIKSDNTEILSLESDGQLTLSTSGDSSSSLNLRSADGSGTSDPGADILLTGGDGAPGSFLGIGGEGGNIVLTGGIGEVAPSGTPGNGGSVTLTGGEGLGQSGDINIFGGPGVGGPYGAGGAVNLTGGESLSYKSGDINIYGGIASTSTVDGGDVYVHGGNASNGNGGLVEILGGSGGSDNGGYVVIRGGSGNPQGKVTIGSANTLQIELGAATTPIIAIGPLQLNDPGTRPTEGSNYRGQIWNDQGGTGVADSLAICRKNAADAYEWVCLDSVSGGGTVTSVAAGNGMDFTAITGSGSVTMGTPGDVTDVSTNNVGTGTHSHAVSGLLKLSGGTMTGDIVLSVADIVGTTGAETVNGGDARLLAGVGGDADVDDPGGTGGFATLAAGDGGAGSATQAGGIGGNVTIAGGIGGATGGAGVGVGGHIHVIPGTGSTNGNINIGNLSSFVPTAVNIGTNAGTITPVVNIYGDINLTADDGITGTNPGKDIDLTAGNGLTSGIGGHIQLLGGNAPAAGAGGYITIAGGTSASGVGGLLDISGGVGSSAGGSISIQGGEGDSGGDLNLVGGLANNGTAGNVQIVGGEGDTLGGNVNINAGAGGTADGAINIAVNTGTAVNVGASLVASSGVQVATASGKTTAASNNRGLVWVDRGSSSTSDKAYISKYNVGAGYSWFPIGQDTIFGLIKFSSDTILFDLSNVEHAVGESTDVLTYSLPSAAHMAYSFAKGNTTVDNITAQTDAGGGYTTITSEAHGHIDGDIVAIVDSTDYDGVYKISNVATDTFRILKTFTSDLGKGAERSTTSMKVNGSDYPGYYLVSVQLLLSADANQSPWNTYLGGQIKLAIYQDAVELCETTNNIVYGRNDTVVLQTVAAITASDTRLSLIIENLTDTYGIDVITGTMLVSFIGA